MRWHEGEGAHRRGGLRRCRPSPSATMVSHCHVLASMQRWKRRGGKVKKRNRGGSRVPGCRSAAGAHDSTVRAADGAAAGSDREMAERMELGFGVTRSVAGFDPAKVAEYRWIESTAQIASRTDNGPAGPRAGKLGRGASCCWQLGCTKRLGRTGLFCATAQAR